MRLTSALLLLILILPAARAGAVTQPGATPAVAAPRQTPVTTPDQPPAVAPGQAAVTLDGRPLFMVRERILSLTPKERARLISRRLERMMRDPLFRAESIAVADAGTSTDIVAGDMIVMSVTDQDAAAEGQSRHETAAAFARGIREALTEHQHTYSVRSIMLDSLYALLTTLVLASLLTVVSRLTTRARRRIDGMCAARAGGLRIQSLELLTAERIAALANGAVRAVRIAVTLALFYVYIPLVFSFFPWTHDYAATLFHYLAAPVVAVGHALGSNLPNLAFIAVICAAAYFVIRFTRLLFHEVGKGTVTLPGFHADWAEPTFKIVRFLIIACVVVAVFPYVPGSDSPAFKGVSIFFGVLFSLGSTSAVANIVAGTILIYTRAFRVGDRVRINDTEGDVVEKNLLVTRIRTIKHVEITIPNAAVLGNHICNYSAVAKDHGLILHTSVTIGYDAPWRTVHRLLIEAAQMTEHILGAPAPFVLQTALNDFYVTYELNAYTDAPHVMAQTYSDLHRNIQDRFNEGGVEIMSPHYAQLRDGNRTTIPADYLPAGYRPGALRVARTDDAGN